MAEETTAFVAIAGMLHDIGKLAQRAGESGTHADLGARIVEAFNNLFPENGRSDLRDAIRDHHKPDAQQPLAKITRVADWLASEKESEGTNGQATPAETALRPITADLDIGKRLPNGTWGYDLNPIALEHHVLFPSSKPTVNRETYKSLWSKFKVELEQLAKLGALDSTNRLLNLQMLLRRFTWCVPATTPAETDEEYRASPNVSLYDHLQVTSATAVCLSFLPSEELDALHDERSEVKNKPVALLLRGDISGIQDFIYRITTPRVDDPEYGGASKRLRGRSLYLALIGEVVPNWIIRQFGLPAVNILYSGGGQFDLLLPLNAGDPVAELERQIQEWLLREFYGELSLHIATEELKPPDFQNLRRVHAALNDKLALKKMRKWEALLRADQKAAEGFFVPKDNLYHTCNVCHLTPLNDPGVCDQCELHREIGKNLPKADYLAWLYDDAADRLPKGAQVIPFEQFGMSAALLEEDKAEDLRQSLKGDTVQAVLYRLNDSDFVIKDAPRSVALGFRFLANAAPLGKYDQVLDFEEIADLSEGAKLLGVLKADVDYLGLLFGEGMAAPTLARVSTLSHNLDLFFTGWLDELCKQIGKLYVVYSGGDDLLILGAWDKILELAQRLYTDFRAYTCQNDNLTLSAGIVLVKPHFPIHRFAKLANEALAEAKDAGRNRINVFEETVEWTKEEDSFERLIQFGEEMAQRVESDDVPKGFVYFLKTLHDQYFVEEEEPNPMWIPKYHYSLGRRLSKEVITDLKLTMNMTDWMPHIQIPVSYVSLKTRKE